MRAKRLAVMVAMTAAMTVPTAAVPAAAFAQQEAPAAPQVAGDEQYASQAGEEFAGIGIVESLGGGRYGLRLGPLEGFELKGDFDFAAFEGETVRVSGLFTIDETRARVLLVESIEPAAAQEGEEVSVTGVVERLPSDGGPSPYGITDEASGVLYVLDRGEGGFSAYEGQRVTITGTAQDTGASYKNLNVSDIRAAQDGGTTTTPAQDTTATLSFEVKTDCAPPEGTTLLGYVPAEGLISAVLADPDGDGTYTGSVAVPKFAPGPRPEGTEPVSVPVLIGQNVGDDSGNIETIKDFGQVKLDGDKAFSADASFCGGGSTGGGTTGSKGGSTSGGGTDNGSGGSSAVVSGGTSNANTKGGGSVDVSGNASASASGGGAVAQSSASPAAKDLPAASGSTTGVVSSAAKALPSSVANVLPSTGGLALPVAGAAGALLIAAFLLVRRISR